MSNFMPAQQLKPPFDGVARALRKAVDVDREIDPAAGQSLFEPIERYRARPVRDAAEAQVVVAKKCRRRHRIGAEVWADPGKGRHHAVREPAVARADVENGEALARGNGELTLQEIDLDDRVEQVATDYSSVHRERVHSEELVLLQLVQQAERVDGLHVVRGQHVVDLRGAVADLPDIRVVAAEVTQVVARYVLTL